MAYTLKRTVLRWGIHDAALLHPAVSILLSTGQVRTPTEEGDLVCVNPLHSLPNLNSLTHSLPLAPTNHQVCGARAMLAEVVAYVHGGSKKALTETGVREREFVFLPSHFYGKALEVLGAEVRDRRRKEGRNDKERGP